MYYAAIHYKQKSSQNSNELLKSDDYSVLEYLEEKSKSSVSLRIDRFHLIESIDEINNAFSTLTYKQAKVIIESILEDKKIKDIALEMNVSQQAISKLKITALNKLKQSSVYSRGNYT